MNRLKGYWRVYQQYVKADTFEEAVQVLEYALGGSHSDFMKLASRFGEDHGRLPDNLHAAALLIGGELCKKYLGNLEKSGKTGKV